MAHYLTQNEKFHIFSKSPIDHDITISQAVNKSGHTVTSSDVWADDIPWFFQVSTNTIAVKRAADARYNDLVLIGDNIYKRTKTSWSSTATFEQLWEKYDELTNARLDALTISGGKTYNPTNIGNVRKTVEIKNSADKVVLNYHVGKQIDLLTIDNNANMESYWAARMFIDEKPVNQFVSPTDKIHAGFPSTEYRVLVYTSTGGGNYGKVTEGEGNDDFVNNSYAGIVQFNKKRSKDDKFAASLFEYVGDALDKALKNISTKEVYNPSDIFDLNLFVKNHLRTHQGNDATDWVYKMIVNGGDITYVPHVSLFYPGKTQNEAKVSWIEDVRNGVEEIDILFKNDSFRTSEIIRQMFWQLDQDAGLTYGAEGSISKTNMKPGLRVRYATILEDGNFWRENQAPSFELLDSEKESSTEYHISYVTTTWAGRTRFNGSAPAVDWTYTPNWDTSTGANDAFKKVHCWTYDVNEQQMEIVIDRLKTIKNNVPTVGTFGTVEKGLSLSEVNSNNKIYHYLSLSTAEYKTEVDKDPVWENKKYLVTADQVETFVNLTVGALDTKVDNLHKAGVSYDVFDSLPNPGINYNGVVALIKGESGDAAISGSYVEYLCVASTVNGNTTYSWEKIGTTKAQLSEYSRGIFVNNNSHTSKTSEGYTILGSLVEDVVYNSLAGTYAVENGSTQKYQNFNSDSVPNYESISVGITKTGQIAVGVQTATDEVYGLSKMFTSNIPSTPSTNESVINEYKKTAVSVQSVTAMYNSLASSITSTKTGIDIGTKAKQYENDDDNSGFLSGVSKINFMGAFVNVVKKDDGTVTVWINKDNNKPTPDETSSIDFGSNVLKKYYVFDGDNYDIPTTNGSQTSESICHAVTKTPTITLKGTKDGVASNTISIPNNTSRIKAVVYDKAGTAKASCRTELIKSGMTPTISSDNITITISNLTQFGEDDAEDGLIPNSVQFNCTIKPTLSSIFGEGDTWSMKVFIVNEDGTEDLIEKFGNYFAYTTKAAEITKTAGKDTLSIKAASGSDAIKTRWVSGEKFIAEGSKFDVTYGSMKNTSYMVTDKKLQRGVITVTSCDDLSLDGTSSDTQTTVINGGTSTFTLNADNDMKASLTCKHTAYSIGGDDEETVEYEHDTMMIWSTGRDDTYNTAYFEKETSSNGYGRILGHIDGNTLVIDSDSFNPEHNLTTGDYANQAKIYDNQLQYGEGTGNKYYVRKFKYSNVDTDVTQLVGFTLTAPGRVMDGNNMEIRMYPIDAVNNADLSFYWRLDATNPQGIGVADGDDNITCELTSTVPMVKNQEFYIVVILKNTSAAITGVMEIK